MDKHVQVPTISNLKELGIKAKDLLVYAAIAKYKNSQTNEAYPSINTISKEIGATAPTILKSISSLVDAGLIEIIKRNGYSSVYKFTKYSHFEIFSYDFLEKSDLSVMEKAYIISISSKLFKDERDHTGVTYYSNKELSNMLNMDRATISSLDKSLQKKNMLELVPTETQDQKVFLFDQFANSVVFELLHQNQRINHIEEVHQRDKEDILERIDRIERKQNAQIIL